MYTYILALIICSCLGSCVESCKPDQNKVFYTCQDTFPRSVFHSHLGCHTSESRWRRPQQGGTPCDVSSPQRQSPSAVTEMWQTCEGMLNYRQQHSVQQCGDITILSLVWSMLFQTPGTDPLSSSPRTQEACEPRPVSPGRLSCCGRSAPAAPETEGSDPGRLQKRREDWPAPNPPPRLSSSSA